MHTCVAGTRIKERDVIELKTGGTGYVGRDGDKVETKKFFDLGAGNGRADLRGQHNAGRSLGGLSIMN